MSCDLHLAAIYRRRVQASLERVWESVLDWEHLPVLHPWSVAECYLLETHARGWTIRLHAHTRKGLSQTVQRLDTDRARNAYMLKTVEGVGEGTEIRSLLTQLGPDETDINIGIFVAEADEARLDVIGTGYLEMFARLWDEAEVMMRHRESQLRMRRVPRTPDTQPLVLGEARELKLRLPFTVGYGGEMWRLVAVGDEIVAHATACPHWFAPLDEVAVENGHVRCPWHGCQFDVRTGDSVDGKGLKLPPAPRVSIEAGVISLVPSHRGTQQLRLVG